MYAYIGITDRYWFEFLRKQPYLDEVNFWRPTDKQLFRALQPGELFLFKLHSPDNYIVGGGIFAHSSILPISLAWESFREANGAPSLIEMRRQIARYRHEPDNRIEDYKIGCIILEQPFFLEEAEWIPAPSDWHHGIQQGKKYDLNTKPGLDIWKSLNKEFPSIPGIREENVSYGKPILTYPRIGQGTFRVLVTDAYERRCAITNEKTLPALDAAHIKPYSESGLHDITNGILLRRDLHALFDQGYITINPSLIVEVSRKIKEEFENGRDYYRFHGSRIHTPADHKKYPAKEFLEWHNNYIYRG